jgi:prolipoprotein diacylglyceryltransferase
LFLYTIGVYGAGRVLLESVREEQDRIYGISVHRTISTGFLAGSLCAFVISWLR